MTILVPVTIAARHVFIIDLGRGLHDRHAVFERWSRWIVSSGVGSVL